MTADPGTALLWTRVDAFLRARGAARLSHPGGTLLEHLGRVHGLLTVWGADLRTRAAGLCHAAYGTDGYDEALLPVTERAVLAELIGARAEALVYLYGSCDRGALHPRLGRTGPVVFRDRFTGAEHTPDEADLRAFLAVTAANELDVMAHNAELAALHGAALHALFTRCAALLPRAAQDACARQLGPYAG